jgi:hypothetical protein
MIPKNIEEGDAALIDTWEANNAKIITWINNSVEHSIGTQLVKYETAKEVWDHLQRLFTQSNFTKQYQLENDIRALHQKNMSIQEFYSAMTDLWDQLALTESAELKACGDYIEHREQQRLVQFLTALRSDFEGLRGSICIVLHCLLLTLLSVSYWLKKYVFSLILKREFFLLQILLY